MVFMPKAEPYKNLIDHFRNWIIRLPESEQLMPLLKLRFKPEEAEFLAQIPFLGHTSEQLSKKLKITPKKLTKKLEKLSKKGIIYRSKRGSEVRYSLRDSLFVLFRSIGWRGKKDRLNREISPYLNQYYIETYAEEFVGHDTQGLRAIPINKTIYDTRQIMPYEDIIKVIDNFEYYSVSACPCSHRHNLDPDFKECKYTLERCLHFDDLGRYCVENGMGREITKEETLKILRMVADAGLVHGVSNTEGRMDTICNCCSCCCLFLESAVKMPGLIPRGHQPSNYIREINEENCIVCGLCARLCPMKALKVENKKLLFNSERCIGCGVCAHRCKHDATYLVHREGEQDFPKDPREQGMRFLKERDIDPMDVFKQNMIR
jgi:formate hydrogenlyase subunit 6/NADH:ubiquinone oxidoreductase subunit I/DNA-binding Lrp family transcriptional regulator